MNETERAELAALLRNVRMARFKGDRKAAYTAAQVNSATWKRAEEAQTIKEHTRIKIVSSLWPETDGDWTQIPDHEPAVMTVGDLDDPRYDAKHMAARIDGLEAQVMDLLDALRRMEEIAGVSHAEVQVADALTDEEKEADRGWELAARRGLSDGQRARRAQDEAGEESQGGEGTQPS